MGKKAKGVFDRKDAFDKKVKGGNKKNVDFDVQKEVTCNNISCYIGATYKTWIVQRRKFKVLGRRENKAKQVVNKPEVIVRDSCYSFLSQSTTDIGSLYTAKSKIESLVYSIIIDEMCKRLH